jgi:hypothetical protein
MAFCNGGHFYCSKQLEPFYQKAALEPHVSYTTKYNSKTEFLVIVNWRTFLSQTETLRIAWSQSEKSFTHRYQSENLGTPCSLSEKSPTHWYQSENLRASWSLSEK